MHIVWSGSFHCRSDQGLTLKRHIEATLGSGNIREAVRLPPGEDLNEWLAVNTVDFYNAISVLFGTLEEFCTGSSCPVMSAGPKVIIGAYSRCAHVSRCLHATTGFAFQADSGWLCVYVLKTPFLAF